VSLRVAAFQGHARSAVPRHRAPRIAHRSALHLPPAVSAADQQKSTPCQPACRRLGSPLTPPRRRTTDLVATDAAPTCDSRTPCPAIPQLTASQQAPAGMITIPWPITSTPAATAARTPIDPLTRAQNL
jgi:hypothetical protein